MDKYIITEKDLIQWYEKALRGKYASLLGERLLNILQIEIAEEFPSVAETPDILLMRGYDFNDIAF